ncbi:helix-turn-helix domain-containing protein [Rhodobacter sp. CZR27]|uniref:AraC family transcriptional regulator n=1 Tax=Rhodobacter sp. CZR27 TaxID=2033869 RepID=UPI0018E07104|nr:helix-turn-helix domain-containing protein [Rhodobacter sp. CZR27]
MGQGFSTGRGIGPAGEHDLTLLAPVAGRLQVRLGGAAYDVPADAVMVAQSGPNVRLLLSGADRPHLIYLMTLPVPGFGDGMPHADRGCCLPSGQVTVLDPGCAARLREALVSTVEGVLGPSASLLRHQDPCAVPSRLLDLLHDAIGPQRVLASLRVRRAEELMRLRADEPLSIADLARELDLGMRSLQIAFRKVRGTGPREVLTGIRLKNARHRLMVADATANVTRIALDSGFTHLGRFSEAYRDAFGERPVDTLRRARRP